MRKTSELVPSVPVGETGALRGSINQSEFTIMPLHACRNINAPASHATLGITQYHVIGLLQIGGKVDRTALYLIVSATCTWIVLGFKRPKTRQQRAQSWKVWGNR